MAVDNDYIFWSSDSVTTYIKRINQDGSNNINVVDVSQYGSMMCTDAAGRLFYTSYSSKHVFSCAIDGTSQSTLIHNVRGNPNGIAIDITNGLLFFSTMNPNHIWKATLDGRNVSSVVSVDKPGPGALAVDAVNQMVYWANGNVIQRDSYQGKKMKIHLYKVCNAGIAFEDEILYFIYMVNRVTSQPLHEAAYRDVAIRISDQVHAIALVGKRYTTDINCDGLPEDEHGFYTDETCTAGDNLYNDNCTLVCQLGYKVDGDPVKTCQLDGSWNSTNRCIDITCDGLPEDEHGFYTDETCTAGDNFYNDNCTLVCQLGYKVDGDPVKTCQLNGSWNSTNRCIVRLCPAINVTGHALLVAGGPPYKPNTVMQYKCQVGFELTEGDLQRSCRMDGVWSGVTPQCTAIKCPVLTSPNYTEVVSGDPSVNRFNETVVFKCSDGHEFIAGDLSTTCLSSKTWSGETPVCRIVSCGPSAPVAHAFLSTTMDAYMTNVTYECHPGFRRKAGGDWTRQCQADKMWSGTPPLCSEIICKPPPSVSTTTLMTGGVQVNDTAKYTCLAGHKLQAGNLTKLCTESGQWTNDDPMCVEIHCGLPIPVANANLTMHNGDTVEGKVAYSCNDGYERLSGVGFSRCELNGNWTQPSLICREVTCGIPPPLKNAVLDEGCARRGCDAIYRCDAGYEGRPTRSRCLENGHWTPASISCTRIRCGEVVGVGSEVKKQTGVYYEDVVTSQCLPGYHRVRGSELRTCLGGGTWSGTPLQCQQTTCHSPSMVVGSKLSSGALTVGSTVTYQPQPRYRHVRGDLIRTCGEDELWSGKQPVFEEIRCPTIGIEEDSLVQLYTSGTVPGSKVEYSCVPGYKIISRDIICECDYTGNWSCETPTCTKVTCGQPPVIDHARAETTGTRYQDTANYTCESGYYRDGPHSRLVCNNLAVWEGEDVVCKAITCPMPEIPYMGTINTTSTTYNSRVVYMCYEGFSLASGEKERTCEANGSWSGETPKCQKVECRLPPNVVNTTWYEDKKSLRQRRVIYQCLPRYSLVSGQLWKTCGPRGDWTGDDAICEATGEELKIFVPEDEEPKTKAEKMKALFGFKKSDEHSPNIAMGAIAVVMLILPALVIFAADFNSLRCHLRMMKRNIQSGYTSFLRRSKRVVPT